MIFRANLGLDKGDFGMDEQQGRSGFGAAAGTIAEAFAQRLAAAPPSRLGQATLAAVEAVHALIRELRPDPSEFRAAVDFLTEVGYYADARRQEWILLCDALGLSALIEDQSNPRPAGATPNTVAGPFYRADVPESPAGADLSRDGKGVPLAVTGRVSDLDGQGIAGASVEVWQANGDGIYENQQPDLQPEFNLRGRFTTDAAGDFRFLTVRPKGYGLPSDGPVGALMAALGLPFERPAHLHFRITAKGHAPLTTHLFDAEDPAIGHDALFAVKPALLARLAPRPTADGRAGFALHAPFVLCPAQPEDGRI